MHLDMLTKSSINDNNNISIDEDKFNQIINQIDTWHGKGEMQEYIGTYLHILDYRNENLDYKIEIVSKEKVNVIPEAEYNKIYKIYKKCNIKQPIQIYKYCFYKYLPHPLSKLASTILRDKDKKNQNIYLKYLAAWKSKNQEEMNFVKELISCVTISSTKKINNVKTTNNISIFKYLSYKLKRTKNISNSKISTHSLSSNIKHK